jgi:hypothetical protein
MLVAANSEAAPKVSADGAERQAPLSLVTYQIAGDGTLKETGMIEFPEQDQLLFWAGFL